MTNSQGNNMATNPDIKDYEGFGNHDESQMPYLPAQAGMLRFVERTDMEKGSVRILQRYEWSHEEAKHDWYDVPLVLEE